MTGRPKPTLRDHLAASWEVFVEDWQALTGREPRPRTAEEKAARNGRRIMLPKRSIIARAQCVWSEALEWMRRHITQRELYRELDELRRLAPPTPTDRDEEAALQRLRHDVVQRVGEEARAALAATPIEDDPEEEAARRSILDMLGIIPLHGEDGAS